jgi:YggT family protein
MSLLASYAYFVLGVRSVLLYAGVLLVAICAVDWAVRTRRINAFSGTARFFRGRIDPLMAPIERMIIRAGGSPGATPLWTIVAYAAFGVLLISILQFAGGVLGQVMFAAAEPRNVPRLIASWVLGILRLALLVRVLSSWLPISPSSPWIRWSYVLTEWLLAPLRRFIPRLGMLDITPIVAWFLITLVEGFFAIG